MTPVINPALRDFIDPLTKQEFLSLERSLLNEGCRDALVLWGDTLIDGHNRYTICQKHGIPFQTSQNDRFSSLEDVMLWMIDNHLARRSVSGFQRGVLALRKKEIVSERRKLAEDANDTTQQETTPDPVSVATRNEIAKLAGISKPAVAQIEKIRKTATPELVEAVRAGTISINAAASVASLSEAQQVAAVAGGKKELQQAARMVREVKQKQAPKVLNETLDEAKPESQPSPVASNLMQELTLLQAENSMLKLKIVELSSELEKAGLKV
ncbi:MAG: hypothetical protein K2P84_14210 [Undibacterium sp.]|nr:hypothetical protein [Undibacterium sp.]